MADLMRGDPVEVCRPVFRDGKIGHEWIPATVVSADSYQISVAYADHTRQAFSLPLTGYIIRNVISHGGTDAGE